MPDSLTDHESDDEPIGRLHKRCKKPQNRSSSSSAFEAKRVKHENAPEIGNLQSSRPRSDPLDDKLQEWTPRHGTQLSAFEQDLHEEAHSDRNLRPSTSLSSLASVSQGKLVNGLERDGVCLDDWSARCYEKYPFLRPDQIRDSQRREPGTEGYNSSTVFIPPAWLKNNNISAGQRQWWTFKADNFSSLLLFKVGKFYELYEMDAHVAVEALGLKYMKGEQAHCGFPEAAYAQMTSALAGKGYKVAVIEQTETPEQLKERNAALKEQHRPTDKVVTREKVAVVTKGTRRDADMIADIPSTSYLMCVCAAVIKSSGACVGFCAIDVASSQCLLSQFIDDDLLSHLRTQISLLEPVEYIIPEDGNEITNQLRKTIPENARVNYLQWGMDGFVDPNKAVEQLRSYFAKEATSEEKRRHFPESLEKWTASPEENTQAWSACGAMISFLRTGLLDDAIIPITSFRFQHVPERRLQVEDAEYMFLDSSVIENLELFSDSNGNVKASLMASVDYCVTPFGKRLLRKWLGRPLVSISRIESRQDAIEDLLNVAAAASGKARGFLSSIPGDLERQLVRLYSTNLARGQGGRESDHVILYEDIGRKRIGALADTLNGLQNVFDAISCYGDVSHRLSSSLLRELVTLEKQFPELRKKLDEWQTATDWQTAKKTGRIIPSPGVIPEFDLSMAKKCEAEEKLQTYLQAIRTRLHCQWKNEVTFLQTKKEKYIVEVAERHVSQIPADLELVSQRKGFKRYTSAALKRLVQQLDTAEDVCAQWTARVLQDLVAKFVWDHEKWSAVVHVASQLDALMSLMTASVCMHGTTCRPKLIPDETGASPIFRATALRHPNLATGADFVPNDVFLGGSSESNFIVLTGANMGGKSTLLRQVCLATLLAQIGAHVPARSMELTIVDAIFVRMGAKDRIICGQSTFFVELAETATMLKNATRRSLVALDELGRGTATTDGEAIAHGVLQYLSFCVQCRGIFATHYHALARRFEQSPHVSVRHMACEVKQSMGDEGMDVKFLYQLTPGIAPKSYGMNVARLAGLPDEVVRQAQEISEQTERRNQNKHG